MTRAPASRLSKKRFDSGARADTARNYLTGAGRPCPGSCASDHHQGHSSSTATDIKAPLPRRPSVPDAVIIEAHRRMCEDGWCQRTAAASVGLQQGPFRKRLVRLGLPSPRPRGRPLGVKNKKKAADGAPVAPSTALPLPVGAEASSYAAPSPSSISASDAFADIPAGLLGEIARFIYATAPRPMAATAIAGALVLLAGIAGGAYVFRDSHLPVYCGVVAEPGAGADGAAVGVNRILSALALSRPTIDAIQAAPAPQNAASGLRRHLNSVRRCAFWAAHDPPILVAEARDVPTHRRLVSDLFTRSRPGDRLPAAEGERAIPAPALSVLATSYPSQHWPRIRGANLLDGVGARFLTLTHEGKPARNTTPQVTPSPDLVGSITALFDTAEALLSKGASIEVEIEPAAAAMLDSYEAEMDQRPCPIHAHRALIAGRIAALCAVGRSPWAPTIYTADVAWAVSLARADADRMQAALAATS